MRAVGIALDQATLQETAYTLGIDKKLLLWQELKNWIIILSNND